MKRHSKCGTGVHLGAEVLVREKYRGIVVGHAQYEHEWLIRLYGDGTQLIHVEDMEAIK